MKKGGITSLKVVASTKPPLGQMTKKQKIPVFTIVSVLQTQNENALIVEIFLVLLVLFLQ